MRAYKPSAAHIQHVDACYRFIHPHYDAVMDCGSLADLNELLIELGHCPVVEVGTYGRRTFRDNTSALEEI